MCIFVSIASYRDPQLVPTIRDCLAKAARPDDLRFGICWQRGPEEEELPFRHDRRFRVREVDWRESRGACWARSEVMGLYDDEDHYLQLDSHHRFVPGWDEVCLRQMRAAGAAKPILTAYATPFTPGDGDQPDKLDREPLQMNFDRFTPEGIILFRPGVIPSWQALERPVRARFLSAHFLFAPGSFVEDVPYDPELYFIGEEITLAVRAFTHGYDLFHPSEIVVWHEYTRSYRTKHWDDHVKAHGIACEWHERDQSSLRRIRAFLAAPTVGRHGLGSARTFREYEDYAGVSFAHRKVQEYTRREAEPPNPTVPVDWAERLRTYQLDLVLPVEELSEGACDDPDFWYVGFHDASGLEVYRQDLDGEELARTVAGPPPMVAIRRCFETTAKVETYTLWPHSASRGWLEKVTRPAGVDRPDVSPRQPGLGGPATVVTALLDLGRGELGGGFARSFEDDDLAQLERLLGAVKAPMVVYLDPRYEERVWRVRDRANTRVVPLRREDLRRFAHYERVQELRRRSEWLAQAGWLPMSPQAALADYNPMVMSKMGWLAEQASANPFDTTHVFWIDAGLCRTVGAERLSPAELGERLSAAADRFLLVSFPYVGSREIHGFPTDALARAAGVPGVDRVMRGGVFGGAVDAVAAVARRYDAALSATLAAGHMGTEESVLTLLAHRDPGLFRVFSVEADGLLGPFFDQLCGTGPAPTVVPTIAPERPFVEDAEVATRGATSFLGLEMMQNRNLVGALDELVRYLDRSGGPAARVFEMGAGMGGMTVLLQLHCLARGAKLTSYELNPGLRETELFRRLAIDLRAPDGSAEVSHEALHRQYLEEIAGEIGRPGRSVVFCDGPNKVAEVQALADYLKQDDVILAHDFAPDREYFERSMRDRFWNWCELTTADLQGAIERNELEPILPDVLQAAAWGGWVKRGTTVKRRVLPPTPIEDVAVYVLGFNSPAQFAAWLESAGRGAPELLECSRKVLLNNSTDASTFAEYDRLCAESGFEQFRLGNLGINGGRIWCARHFAEQTTCDAMLYFEDDMMPRAEDGSCPNGFRTRVPNLLCTLKTIAYQENLDFLKLSFTELHGDHTENWAFRNMGDEERQRYFPDGPATRFEAIKSRSGVPYAVGDVFYSNWPMLVTRRGNQTLFLEGNVPTYEQLLMVHALKLARAGLLRAGVLLASPIDHNRFEHYPAEARREC